MAAAAISKCYKTVSFSYFCKKKKNMNFIWLHDKKIYNSGYSTEIVNEQCNTGDPLETSGGLYRGPPSMLIYY